MWKIPLSSIDLGVEEEQAVLRVLRSGWLSMGPETEAFESAFAAQTGVAHAIAVSSGTAALHLALLAAGVGPGDEVIVPSLSFVATAHAVIYCGARPVFADAQSTLRPLIDPVDVSRRMTRRTRAIVPMHYAGALCDMAALRLVAGESGCALIEDAAHAPGVPGVAVSGDAACFSLFANKNLVAGEGGFVTTNDPDWAQAIRRLRSHGMSSPTYDRWRGKSSGYDVTAHGFNYRITELQSAVGRAQLDKLETARIRRAEIAAHYRRRLDARDLAIPFDEPPSHLMVVVLPEGVERDRVRSRMQEMGIQTSVHYPPIHRFSAFASVAVNALPVTESLAPLVLTLPLYTGLTDADVDLVCAALAQALEGARC